MLEWVSRDRHYKPEIVAAMTSAFDTVCRSLLAKDAGERRVTSLSANIRTPVSEELRDRRLFCIPALERVAAGSDRPPASVSTGANSRARAPAVKREAEEDWGR